MSVLNTLVRYGYVPFMMLGLNGVAYWVVADLVVARGHAWAYLLLLPLLALAYAIAFAAEHIAPFFEDWNDHKAHGDTLATVIHLFVYEYQSIVGVLLIPFICWLFPYQGLWPVEWPLWGQVLMAFIIADFAFMVTHYVSHRWRPMWRLHAVHHGLGRLYGLNGVLRHPVHQVIDMIVAFLPLVIIGMPVSVAFIVGYVVSVTLIVQHSNVDAYLGPLGKYLAIGRIHHLHHVNWGTEGDCNFGLFFAIWDRMFGTFQETPSRPIKANDLGVDEVPNFPKGYIEQFLFPIFYKPGEGEPERYTKAAATKTAPTAAQEARRVIDAAE